MLSRVIEWLIINLVFKASLAMSLGVALEVLVQWLLACMFSGTELYQTLLGEPRFEVTVIAFIAFHVLGWFLVLRDWKFLTGERLDVDPHYQGGAPKSDFTIDHGSYVIKGNIYRKA